MASGKACIGVGMQNAGLRNPPRQQRGETIPPHLCPLTATYENAPPQPANASAMTDASDVEYASQGGYGPDRQWFQLPSAGPIQLRIHVYAEDGATPVASGIVNVSAGKVYDLVTTSSR